MTKMRTMHIAKDMRVTKDIYRKNYDKIKKRKSELKVKSKDDFKTVYKFKENN